MVPASLGYAIPNLYISGIEELLSQMEANDTEITVIQKWIWSFLYVYLL